MPKFNEYRPVERLELPEPIVTARTYPVTAHGDQLLRAIRRTIQSDIAKNSGREVQVPFPTALYMMMRNYADIKGITVLEEDKIPLPPSR